MTTHQEPEYEALTNTPGAGFASQPDPSTAVPYSVDVLRDEKQQALDELADWWAKASDLDAQMCLAKLDEYGSSDFDIMAQSMIAVGGGAWTGATDDDKARIGREMAIAFYLQGKVARAFGAFQSGRVPSADTIDDIIRYGMMWRRVRETGRWGA